MISLFKSSFQPQWAEYPLVCSIKVELYKWWVLALLQCKMTSLCYSNWAEKQVRGNMRKKKCVSEWVGDKHRGWKRERATGRERERSKGRATLQKSSSRNNCNHRRCQNPLDPSSLPDGNFSTGLKATERGLQAAGREASIHIYVCVCVFVLQIVHILHSIFIVLSVELKQQGLIAAYEMFENTPVNNEKKSKKLQTKAPLGVMKNLQINKTNSGKLFVCVWITGFANPAFF